MGKDSAIEWTDATFNPVHGCTKVGPGCDHCYAEKLSARYGFDVWGPGKPRREFGDKHWAEPYKWNAKARDAGKRLRVFCASMADWLDNEWPAGTRERLCEMIEDTEHLDWLLLTKRIGNALKMAPEHWRDEFPSNVWLGISVVNQEEAERDIPKLLAVPARVRFLSCEPLLGPINLEEAWHGESALDGECWGDCAWCEKGYPPLHNCRQQGGLGWCDRDRSGIDWIIVGGESGPGARPMHPDWARSIRDQCADAGVPFFFKQWGEWTPGENVERQSGVVPSAHWFNDKWTFGRENLARDDGHIDDEPDLYRVGKKAAGRLLDGREHSAFPAPQSQQQLGTP